MLVPTIRPFQFEHDDYGGYLCFQIVLEQIQSQILLNPRCVLRIVVRDCIRDAPRMDLGLGRLGLPPERQDWRCRNKVPSLQGTMSIHQVSRARKSRVISFLVVYCKHVKTGQTTSIHHSSVTSDSPLVTTLLVLLTTYIVPFSS